MDRETALKLSKEFKVHYLQLLREEWEMVILKRLFESALGKNLVFKGGTALRLAYNSPRFSEDLDFSILPRIEKSRSSENLGELYANLSAVPPLNTRFFPRADSNSLFRMTISHSSRRS